MKEFLKKHKKEILKTLIVVAVLASIAVGAYFILRACGFTSTEEFLTLRDKLGDSFTFWLIVGALQVFQVIFIPVSNQIITVPLAVIFPVNELWKVFLTSWISIWVATLLLYLIGRFGGAKLLDWILGDKEKTEKCSNFLKKGWFFYPLGMLLPLPDDIITTLAGVSRMNFIFVAVCALFTRAVDVACSVWGWGYLTKFWWGWVILVTGIILLGVLTFILYKIQKSKKTYEEKR